MVTSTEVSGESSHQQDAASPHVFEHKRRKPEEWDEFEVIAIEAVDKPLLSRLRIDNSQPLYESMQGLDRTTLDRNLYYGYGKIVCALAQGMARPGHREAIVERGVSRIVEATHADKATDPTQQIVKALRSNILQLAVHSEVVAAYGTLPRSEQMVMQALKIEAKLRSRNEIEEQLSRRERIGRAFAASRAYRMMFASEFASNATGGTGDICGVIIDEMISRDGGLQKDAQFRKAIELLKEPGVEKVFERCSALTLKDLIGRADKFVHIVGEDDDVKVVFEDRREPGLQNSSLYDSIHDEQYFTRHRDRKLSCPALGVRGAIPLMKGVVVETVETAADRLGVARALA